MSGIYIPDWGKPEICTDCPCFNEYTQCCQVDIMADIDNCPLIPVPDHGRLGELDALAEQFWNGQAYFTDAIKRKLQTAPTIIPADPGGASPSPTEEADT